MGKRGQVTKRLFVSPGSGLAVTCADGDMINRGKLQIVGSRISSDHSLLYVQIITHIRKEAMQMHRVQFVNCKKKRCHLTSQCQP